MTWWYGQVLALSVWGSQASSSGVGTVLTLAYVWAMGDLCFGLPIWCSCGAFGWFPEAPLLHHSLFQSVVGGLAGRREGEGHATSDHLDDAVVLSKGSG